MTNVDLECIRQGELFCAVDFAYIYGDSLCIDLI